MLIVMVGEVWSVSLSVSHDCEPCKNGGTPEPIEIEMSFGVRTLVGPRNHVLDGVQIPPHWKGDFEGKWQLAAIQ